MQTQTIFFALIVVLAASIRPAIAEMDRLRGTQPGELPEGGFFESAEVCGGCHQRRGDEPEWQHMPVDTFAGTMMANSVRDPVFFAALTVANQDLPGIGTYCLRCHAPLAFVRGHATPPDGSGFDPHPAQEGFIDTQGVGCDSCHRAVALPPDDPDFPYYLGDAQLTYTDDPERTKHGPYADALVLGHQNVVDPNLRDSRFCGQCHQVTNPEVRLRDAKGAPTELEFPLDTTYEEWAASDFRDGGAQAQSCIDCHMRRVAGDWPVVTRIEAPLRHDPRDHVMVGGNHWGIQAVMAANPERAQEFAASFQLAQERTLENLASAAKITVVDAPATVLAGQTFELRVRVENLSGHKFPTGYAESRQAWVAVFLVDAEGNETPLLGAYDAATGEIQAEPATHVYKTIQGRWDPQNQRGAPEEHLALHDMILSDTRIPPAGLVPSVQTMPSAEIDYSDGHGGLRNVDEASFTLSAPVDLAGSYSLSARVYYQSMTRHYVEFLREENRTDARGEELAEIYRATGEAPPILVASAEEAIELVDPRASGCGCCLAGAREAGWLVLALILGLGTRRRRL